MVTPSQNPAEQGNLKTPKSTDETNQALQTPNRAGLATEIGCLSVPFRMR